MRNFTTITAPVMLAAILLISPQGDASAHHVFVRDYPYYDSDAVYFTQRRATMPRWLRRNADFVRWYYLNHHYQHYARDYAISWKRLYRRYERDYHYHRIFKGNRWKRSHKRWAKTQKRWAKSYRKRHKPGKRRRNFHDD